MVRVRWLLATGFLLLCGATPHAMAATASELQKSVNQAMAGRRGTAVVVAVESGRMMAAYHLDVAAQRLAAPGSSIKPFTLLALLQQHVVDAQTATVCKRPLTIAGHRLDCSHPQTGQPLDAAGALAYSCNSYFTSMAARLTPAQLRESFLHDGLASVRGLAPQEATGAIALAQSRDELELQAIGEWGVRITPLELLRAYRNLALSAGSKRDAQLAPLWQGLEGSTRYGMARLAQPATGFRVAGKTGTANSDEGQWTHGWFAGFAPADKPDFVVVVFLEKGRGSDAAEIAAHIFAALNGISSSHESAMAGTKR